MKNAKKTTYTYTTQFLFPLLNIDKQLFYVNNSKLNNTRFINAFLNDPDVSDYNMDHLYVVHHNFQDSNFKMFEDTLTSFDNYVDSYDECGGLISIKIFKIPKEYINDYQHFLNGKYSKFSEQAVKRILSNNFDITSEKKRLIFKGIFNKATELKKLQESRLSVNNSIVDIGNNEVWSIFDIKTNTLTKEIKKSFCHIKLEPETQF